MAVQQTMRRKTPMSCFAVVQRNLQDNLIGEVALGASIPNPWNAVKARVTSLSACFCAIEVSEEFRFLFSVLRRSFFASPTTGIQLLARLMGFPMYRFEILVLEMCLVIRRVLKRSSYRERMAQIWLHHQWIQSNLRAIG